MSRPQLVWFEGELGDRSASSAVGTPYPEVGTLSRPLNPPTDLCPLVSSAGLGLRHGFALGSLAAYDRHETKGQDRQSLSRVGQHRADAVKSRSSQLGILRLSTAVSLDRVVGPRAGAFGVLRPLPPSCRNHRCPGESEPAPAESHRAERALRWDPRPGPELFSGRGGDEAAAGVPPIPGSMTRMRSGVSIRFSGALLSVSL